MFVTKFLSEVKENEAKYVTIQEQWKNFMAFRLTTTVNDIEYGDMLKLS